MSIVIIFIIGVGVLAAINAYTQRHNEWPLPSYTFGQHILCSSVIAGAIFLLAWITR